MLAQCTGDEVVVAGFFQSLAADLQMNAYQAANHGFVRGETMVTWRFCVDPYPLNGRADGLHVQHLFIGHAHAGLRGLLVWAGVIP